MYEYSLFGLSQKVKGFTSGSLLAEEFAEQLAGDGGGAWDAVSHHLLLVEDEILVTILARRPLSGSTQTTPGPGAASG